MDEINDLLSDLKDRCETAERRVKELERAVAEARSTSKRRLGVALVDLRLAQRIAHIGNWTLDPVVGVPVWSDEIYAIYERDPDLGPIPVADYPKLYSDRHWETFNSAISAAVHEGKPYDIELHLVLPSGTEKWVHAICEPEAERGPEGHRLRGTIQDITKRRLAELEDAHRSKALAEAHQKMKGLALRLQEIQEEERSALARDLHDGIGQDLVALGVDLAFVEEELGSEVGDLRGLVARMRTHVATLVDRITEHMITLRPPGLDILGLSSAIEEDLARIGKRHELETSLSSRIGVSRFAEPIETQALRIFREAVSNVVRHADARSVRVVLDREVNTLILIVEDDGKGISEAQIEGVGSLGLLGMKERANLLGGSLTVENRAAGGTRVTARLPLPGAEDSMGSVDP